MRIFLYILLLFLPALAGAQALNSTGVCVGRGNPNVGNLLYQNQLIECSIYKDTLTGLVYVYNPTLPAEERWELLLEAISGITKVGNKLFLGGNLQAEATIIAANYGFSVINANNVVLQQINGDVETSVSLSNSDITAHVYDGTTVKSTFWRANKNTGILATQNDIDGSAARLTLSDNVTDQYVALTYDRDGANIDSITEIKLDPNGIFLKGVSSSAYKGNAVYYNPATKKISYGTLPGTATDTAYNGLTQTGAAKILGGPLTQSTRVHGQKASDLTLDDIRTLTLEAERTGGVGYSTLTLGSTAAQGVNASNVSASNPLVNANFALNVATGNDFSLKNGAKTAGIQMYENAGDQVLELRTTNGGAIGDGVVLTLEKDFSISPLIRASTADAPALMTWDTLSEKIRYVTPYTAGTGIAISTNNVISATGGGGGSMVMGNVTTPTPQAGVISGSTLQLAQANGSNMGVITLAGDLTGTAAAPLIATDAVDAAEIAAGAVGTSEIAASAVTNAKIATGTITLAKLGQNSATTGQAPIWNGTAWAAANVIGSVGAFSETGNASAASVASGVISLSAASGTTPGAVSLADEQILGSNTKILQENSAGVSVPLRLRNTSATGTGHGAALDFQVGSTPVTVATVQTKISGATATNGTEIVVQNTGTDNVLRTGMTITAGNVLVAEGFLGGSFAAVTTTLDASTDINARKRNYFLSANATLILPDPGTLPVGTMTDIDATFEAGKTGLIITPVTGYQEFSFSTDQSSATGDQFHTDTLKLDAMKSVSLKVVMIGGNARWKVLIHQ